MNMIFSFFYKRNIICPKKKKNMDIDIQKIYSKRGFLKASSKSWEMISMLLH